ncbi:hypothetical protein [Chitinophaga solisilvae]|uniref:hypothetical protein n=1 Tax=Chitinophaga solisilvae TaxID=1233460 RepID=UPI00136EA17E|nr:hypothetical protein [Chitinophaga solisilvae]
MKQTLSLFVLSVVFFMLQACSTKTNAPVQLQPALTKAGANRTEIQAVIDHYSSNPADSLKLRAALFLISGMPGRGYEKYALADSGLNNVEINLFQYKFKDSIRKMKEHLEKLRGKEIIFENKGFREDIQHISAQQLIENIDCAFSVKEQPWAKHLSFAQFCEYILPYRMGEEPLQNWRKRFYTQTAWITDSCMDKSVLATSAFINDSIKRGYSYKHLGLFYYPGNLNLQQLNDLTGGRCQDLNMIACYWFRAAGLPVASEFTPFWANSNFGGHLWLSILDKDGRFVPITAGYDNPRRDTLPFENKLAKAYRIMYSVQANSLAAATRGKETIPPHLANEHLADITDEYIPATNITIRLQHTDTGSHYAYLGVLNGESWQIVGWGKINASRDSATFLKAGQNVIYIPMVIVNNNYEIAGDPFLLNNKGETEWLIPSGKKTELVFNEVDGSRWLNMDRKYHLIYWNKGKWEDLEGTQTIVGDPQVLKKNKQSHYLHFSNVPEQAVLRMVRDTIFRPNDLGRPVVLKNGKYNVY